MRTTSLTILALILGLGLNSLWCESERTTIPFKALKTTEPPGSNYAAQCISVQLPNQPLTTLGIVRDSGVGVFRLDGVDESSITVEQLGRRYPLLLISWKDFLQGLGAYQNQFFIIASTGNLGTPILKRSIPLSGHSGGDSNSAELSVSYVEPILRIKTTFLETEERNEWGDSCDWEGDEATNDCLIDFSVTEVFDAKERKLLDTTIRYRVRSKDNVQSVSRLLGLEPSALNLEIRPHEWITIDLLSDTAEKLFQMYQGREFESCSSKRGKPEGDSASPAN